MRTLDQTVSVVHPGIVAAHVAAADEYEIIFRTSTEEVRFEALEIRHLFGRGAMDFLIRRMQAIRQAGFQRAEIDTVGMRLQLVEVQFQRVPRGFAVLSMLQR